MTQDNLKEIFKFSEFKPGQKEVVDSILAGHDTLAIMPTGGGKSLCYQMPALLNNKVTIVISPLIALMKDQVDGLKARGIGAAFINSSQDYSEIQAVLNFIKSGQIKLLYIAPERLKSSSFQNMFQNLGVCLVAVDEAHCVSNWGHDFRPDYMLINEFVAKFSERPIVAAFTATATPEVRADIIKHLGLREAKVFVRGFDRPNLKLSVEDGLSEHNREQLALEIIKKTNGSGILYTLTRKNTERLAGWLQQNKISAVAYHAGLNTALRKQVQEDFMENKYKVIVATIAFGMGVDKADIRFVIHLGLPASLENYYQEAGRAGRDGEPSECFLLSNKKDFGLQSYFIQKSREEMLEQGKKAAEMASIIDIKYRKLDQMRNYAQTMNCRRKIILNYFSDPEIKNYTDNCRNCDICLNERLVSQPIIKKNVRSMPASPFDQMNYPENGPSFDETRAFDLKVGLAGHDRPALEVDRGFVLGEDDQPELPETCLKTVDLYKQKFSLEQIAKIRQFGVSTIFGHLIRWYASGGELNFSDFVSVEEQKLILAALATAGDDLKLKPIKEKLPETISYEKIKLVIAKVQRVRL
ncbi:MAG: RecQ family ATP-dependent DNA helicase [Patescibacteria group bacterium]|mgnify:FL=1